MVRRLLAGFGVFAFLLCLIGAVHAAGKEPPVVAVLYFDYEGKDADLAMLKKGLASMLISDLAGLDSIRVVERDRLEAVLGELKLQATNKIDQATAVKAGKLLGARYLVLGGYFDVMKTLRIDTRVIEVETGKIVLSIGANGKPEDFLSLEQKIAGDLTRHFTKVAPPVPPPSGATPPRKRPKLPAKLPAKTAAEYGRALAAIDSGDKKAAEAGLKKVVTEAPEFELAQLDLDRMMK
jgi:TolB-like protein